VAVVGVIALAVVVASLVHGAGVLVRFLGL
jgi:hypothetical protein